MRIWEESSAIFFLEAPSPDLSPNGEEWLLGQAEHTIVTIGAIESIDS